MSNTWQDDVKFDPNDKAERMNLITVIREAFPEFTAAVIEAAIDPAVVPQPKRGRVYCALLVAKHIIDMRAGIRAVQSR